MTRIAESLCGERVESCLHVLRPSPERAPSLPPPSRVRSGMHSRSQDSKDSSWQWLQVAVVCPMQQEAMVLRTSHRQKDPSSLRSKRGANKLVSPGDAGGGKAARVWRRPSPGFLWCLVIMAWPKKGQRLLLGCLGTAGQLQVEGFGSFKYAGVGLCEGIQRFT